MRTLIVEDDPTSAMILQNVLSAYGHCDTVVNGKDAVEAFQRSLDKKEPYDLICMDIMMPELSGQEALRLIRKIENEAGIATEKEVKVFMTTALSQTKEVEEALYKGGATAFFVKPINIDNLIKELRSASLIEE